VSALALRRPPPVIERAAETGDGSEIVGVLVRRLSRDG
jgi:hypothetical protein